MLEIEDDVIDIREQYPLLPIEDTLEIANELGIEHPRHPQTEKAIVMITDFLITYKKNLSLKDCEITVKSKEELLNKRVLFSIYM